MFVWESEVGVDDKNRFITFVINAMFLVCNFWSASIMNTWSSAPYYLSFGATGASFLAFSTSWKARVRHSPEWFTHCIFIQSWSSVVNMKAQRYLWSTVHPRSFSWASIKQGFDWSGSFVPRDLVSQKGTCLPSLQASAKEASAQSLANNPTNLVPLFDHKRQK